MRLLAVTVLSLSIVAGTASGQQTTIERVKAMPTTEDIRAVAPALEKYAKGARECRRATEASSRSPR